jgi:hypothetical protein
MISCLKGIFDFIMFLKKLKIEINNFMRVVIDDYFALN